MQAGLKGMVIFFIVFTTAVVTARVVMQLLVHRRLYWDDVWLLLSLVCLWSFVPSLSVSGASLSGRIDILRCAIG